MWLIMPSGFYSIVCKSDDSEAGTLTIRARVKADLEALRQDCLSSLGAFSEDAGTDYRFRAKGKRDEVTKAIAKLVQQIDYSNFKNEVADRQGHYRAEVYHRGWDAHFKLQQGVR